MKVLFKNLLNGYVGKTDDSVIYYNRALNRCIIRRKPHYVNHPAHPRFSDVAKNLKLLNPSIGYREDLKQYLIQYRKQHRDSKMLTWNNLWYKLMWAMSRRLQIDLATLSYDEIYDLMLPCRTVKAAVEADLIPEVKGYEDLDQEI